MNRETIQRLVERELERRLTASSGEGHPALQEFAVPASAPQPGCDDPALNPAGKRPCVIEPDKPCIQSGYCKKLGH